MSFSASPTTMEAEARIRAALPIRLPNSHKGTYGNALLYCGSAAYTGAAMLAAMGALHVGAGITHLAAPEEVLLPIRIRLPEVVCHPTAALIEAPGELTRADKLAGSRGAILLGCGIGRGSASQAAAFCEALSALLAYPGVPVVLDADALNMLAGDPCVTCDLLAAAKRPVLLTPHPMEFSRLSGLSIEQIQRDRTACARAFAQKARVTLLLKGHGTVIASASGRCTVNPSGSSALAKGGSGDVLAGVITGLLAGGMQPEEAAFAGAYLHGAAAEILERQNSAYGVLPSSLPAAIAREICRLVQTAPCQPET